MTDDLLPQSETPTRLDPVLEPYFAKHHREKCYPGLIFRQGKRQMVQINVPADDLPTLLQAKPSSDNDPDSGKNRPEVKGHAEEIKEYILKRATKGKPWILGTLTANVDPSKIELIELGRGICLVVIPRGVKLDITDGQHRKSAIQDLIIGEFGEVIGDNDFPITLVLEPDFNQCQSDFRDMAQTKQLDKSLLLSFGEFEGRVGITKRVLDEVVMFRGKTEKIKSSPPSKKKLIYTTNYIAKLVGAAFSGDSNSELKERDVDKASDALIHALNQFFSECSQSRHIVNTHVDDLSIDEIENFKNENLLGRSVGMEILGHLLYCIYDKNVHLFDPNKISTLAQLNWSREGHLWRDNVVLLDPNPKNPAKPYKITAGVNAIRIAVNRVKTHLGWM
ncbi:DNA sulfur modification protein DndB [Laspinema olomoucense]|uniref:DNA sulfur modification protein DndB n=1 Tax=Laspinema olomoucense D3b TaxID=2953688 RepID=A0ABT2NDA5_9CYAN|nr:DNA sulfur modification protein DndB [Laspinema sp. D3b]MCT7980683.1 DNA sulfur modification protein DndB [Laspinema sp. D3b]